METLFVDSQITDYFSVVDHTTELLVSGLDSTSFDVALFDPDGLDRTDSTPVDWGVAEVGEGYYKLWFTPDSVGVWLVAITHTVYFSWGKSQSFNIVASDYYGISSSETSTLSNTIDDILVFVLGLY